MRSDPHLLLVGDEVIVPSKSPPTFAIPTGAERTYTVFTQTLHLKLLTVDATGEPAAVDGSTFQVDGVELAALVAGGTVDVTVPRDAKEVTFKVEADDTEALSVSVGALRPLREVGGLQARLENLGYGVFGDDAELDDDDTDGDEPDSDERLELAMELFQEAGGKSPTGYATDDDVNELRERAGA